MPSVRIDPANPDRTVHEQLRAGSFQIGAVLTSLEDAVTHAKGADPGKAKESKAALAGLLDLLDSAGAGLAKYADDPPSQAEVTRKFAAYDERRLKGIEASNDALHDLREAQGVAEELAADSGSKPLEEVVGLLDLAVEDLQAAIRALGGRVES